MLLVASETGHVYTFATRKLQPILSSEAGSSVWRYGIRDNLKALLVCISWPHFMWKRRLQYFSKNCNSSVNFASFQSHQPEIIYARMDYVILYKDPQAFKSSILIMYILA